MLLHMRRPHGTESSIVYTRRRTEEVGAGVVQQVGIWVLTGALVVVLALWSTRAINPLWPALVFMLGRGTISYATGATLLTAVSTAAVAFVLGAVYFWALQRVQGRLVWWFLLVVGVVLFSI